MCQSHGTAICLEWKVTSVDLNAGGSNLLKRETNSDNLRVSEADCRNANLIPNSSLTNDDLCHHRALGHCPMCQHRLTSYVPDGINAAHRGMALIIDTNKRPSISRSIASRPHPSVAGLRPAV